jgi:hypothetical protein
MAYKAADQQEAVDQEIRSIVGDCIRSRSIIDATIEAPRLVRAYPSCGMNSEEVRLLLLKLSAAARISVAF